MRHYRYWILKHYKDYSTRMCNRSLKSIVCIQAVFQSTYFNIIFAAKSTFVIFLLLFQCPVHWPLFACKKQLHKLTRKRNATNHFPRHFSHVVLNGFIFIYRYAGLYTFHALSIFLQSQLYFRSIYRRCKKCTCGSCGLTTWGFDT